MSVEGYVAANAMSFLSMHLTLRFIADIRVIFYM
ncbi:hypothetical protein ANAPH1_00219 [Anaplasma phagocytophilum]|nr:hypothetical protein ANAPH1_00219 [Anaplasma phagocytophilum]SCV64187.1 hypothetical protein ANAPH2_00875 [Anaplasma phagocytophilum]